MNTRISLSMPDTRRFGMRTFDPSARAQIVLEHFRFVIT